MFSRTRTAVADLHLVANAAAGLQDPAEYDGSSPRGITTCVLKSSWKDSSLTVTELRGDADKRMKWKIRECVGKATNLSRNKECVGKTTNLLGKND